MSTKDRIMLFPSRANHVLMKARIVSANKGLSLLKRKRDALELKLREIVAKRAGVAENFNELFSNAIFSIAKAKFLDTDFKPAPIIGSDRADACMRLTYTKTIGLQLPTFEPVLRKSESLPLTGLSRGGAQVDVIRDNFQELLKTLILLASYDYSIRILNESIRANNMRLNGLEYVVIPRFNNTAAYISEELDELEREEFYRLKRSQAKQRAIKEKEKKAKMLELLAEAEGDEESMGTASLFEERKSMKPQIVPIPISIYMKKKSASAAQTIITGHFPGSQELISPTDSIVSGDIPTVAKRSSFNIFNRELKVPIASDAQPSTAQQAPSMRASIAAIKPTKRVSLIDQKFQPVLPDHFSDHFVTPESSPATSKQASIDGSANLPVNDVDVKIKREPTNATDLVGTKNVPSTVSATATPSVSAIPSVPNNTADPSGASSVAPLAHPSFFSTGADTSVRTSSALIDSQKYADPISSATPSATVIPSSSIKTEVDVLDAGVQTDITGRYPRSSEMKNPFFTGTSDAQNAESQTVVSGRRGRYSNTDKPDGVHTSESENEQNAKK